ncbi:hypothetical protein DUI87_05703 [Hirundo rustica rustica]|uniref:Taste receptor type 2 n=1 Tax=Hirundo rustica rustica TaxID=333673 RepID=A0A3M0KWD7_HIRRU|nr:hypothetical protein DUI87_05703 [Hirundo rustica rustica]
MEACHSPQEYNVTSYGDTALAIITLEAFAGMWINAFIVSVLCIGWIKKKTMNSNEKILLLLGCSRSWYLGVHSLFLIFSNPKLKKTLIRILSCVKCKVCMRNSFFIYLKVKIDRMVSWLLFGSVIFSLTVGILVYNTIDKAVCKNHNFTCLRKFWKETIRTEEHFYPIFFLTGFLHTTSFMVVIFSAVFLLFSLWRHKCKMQTNSMKDLSTEAHTKAMKSILSFLVMYSINFVSLILTLVYSTKYTSQAIFTVYIIQHAYPGIHSLILIFSNPKLEKALLKILSCVKCKFLMK